MKNNSFKIIRVSYTDEGTFGVLFQDRIPFALTLERPWKNNQKGESCIPLDTYLCQRVQSPKFGNTFEIMDVPFRSNILFHKGNLMDDSHGCIIIGEMFHRFPDGKSGVLASKQGFDEFLERTKDLNRFFLTIKQA